MIRYPRRLTLALRTFHYFNVIEKDIVQPALRKAIVLAYDLGIAAALTALSLLFFHGFSLFTRLPFVEHDCDNEHFIPFQKCNDDLQFVAIRRFPFDFVAPFLIADIELRFVIDDAFSEYVLCVLRINSALPTPLFKVRVVFDNAGLQTLAQKLERIRFAEPLNHPCVIIYHTIEGVAHPTRGRLGKGRWKMAVTQSRTQWAEKQTEEFLAGPFISEFVFRSPQMLDGTQKEVADFLIIHKGNGLVVSQKAQDDPLSRDEHKNGLWVLKAAKKGLGQLLGALRPSTKAIWCEHPRRGRVEFSAGLPQITHGIVTVETFRPVDLQSEAADLPLEQTGVPITYISLNDFLNVATQLRTVPELLRYLNARRDLPEAALRRVGDERPIFEFYLLHGTLKQCRGHEHAAEAVEAASDEIDEVLGRMPEYHHFSGLMEHVADALATRSATCLDGLPANLATKYDATGARQNYLRMQEVLTDLPLRDRAALGKQFATVIENLSGRSEGYTQATARLDSRPNWVFVFGSSKGWAREGMLHCIEPMMRAALSYYQKQQCMFVIDRNGEGYEVAITRQGETFTATPEDDLAGNKLFSRLRVTSVALEGF